MRFRRGALSERYPLRAAFMPAPVFKIHRGVRVDHSLIAHDCLPWIVRPHDPLAQLPVFLELLRRKSRSSPVAGVRCRRIALVGSRPRACPSCRRGEGSPRVGTLRILWIDGGQPSDVSCYVPLMFWLRQSQDGQSIRHKTRPMHSGSNSDGYKKLTGRGREGRTRPILVLKDGGQPRRVGSSQPPRRSASRRSTVALPCGMNNLQASIPPGCHQEKAAPPGRKRRRNMAHNTNLKCMKCSTLSPKSAWITLQF